MKTIWKANLKITAREQALLIPVGSKILTIQMQDGEPVLWFECDSEETKVTFTVQMFGTGHSIPENLKRKYISTVQEGILVWHFFELIK